MTKFHILKKRIKHIFHDIPAQIEDDMVFWINYRPSTWLSFIFNGVKTKYKKISFSIFLIISFIIFGVIPTSYFLFSNFLKIWLIPFLVPFFYWCFAIIVVYSRSISLIFIKFIVSIFDIFIFHN